MPSSRPHDEDGDPAGVTVLVVCTANVCRSPVAERLLARRLAGSGVTVTSAGTRAPAGMPLDPPMAALLEAAGVPAASSGARELRAADLRQAGLVLTMTREHRAAVVQLAPAALRRTFLLTEAVAVAEAAAAAGWPADVAPSAAARLAALPGLAARYRVPGAAPAEVADPHRRPAEEYRRCFAELEDAVDRLARALG
ncbi:protein-tyrosine-phosphatase [Geodermatophilus aquaeductus]|uniref:protein-tyrosine-phosphatase n=1 Tax=Geodermatophilus aquaeductus TaxID=1564161 RepID=A0A521CPF8_9ACTN|nr:low molecular weight phosphatase family protein [Geodermatophilus aquaeductus]SMO61344.1 protein-tyrosine phosphatase [Geodermatophilus aquaeductus]